MMSHLSSYLNYIETKNPGIAPGIQSSTDSFRDDHLANFDYTGHNIGLIAGHVQSGKTGQMLGIISTASDLDFRFFIMLTSDNIRLQKQTIVRAKTSLSDVIVCDENDDVLFRKATFSKPVLLIIKKNKRVLESWFRYLSMDSAARYQPLIMLDDEGDAASLNTQVNKNDVSTINGLIRSIINIPHSSLFITVTATPYANLLQTKSSGMRPSFVHIVEPGSGYLGGDNFYLSDDFAFFTDEAERDILLRTDEIPVGFRKAILYFILVCIEFRVNRDIGTCNFLIHPSIKIIDHETVGRKLTAFLDALKSELNSANSFLRFWVKDGLNEFGNFSCSLDECWENMEEILNDISILIINSNSGESDYENGFNIVIGGNSLGRGVTFPRLQVTYYCRTSKVPQADTVWQHSRLFGYDREPDVCKLFLPSSLHHLFKEFTESNNALFATLADKGIDGITILSPPGTRPTRKNVIHHEYLISFVGGVNYFTIDTSVSETDVIDGLLGYSDESRIISSDDAAGLLEYLCDKEESEVDSYLSCLKSLEAKGFNECLVHIRTDRDISKGTGTLLSPNDRRLSQQNKDQIVLFMYRLNGKAEQGWNDVPLWIPNIRFPDGICFYAVE